MSETKLALPSQETIDFVVGQRIRINGASLDKSNMLEIKEAFDEGYIFAKVEDRLNYGPSISLLNEAGEALMFWGSQNKKTFEINCNQNPIFFIPGSAEQQVWTKVVTDQLEKTHNDTLQAAGLSEIV